MISIKLEQYFIRYNAAANIADRMKFLGESVQKASASVVKTLGENEGIGGVIALDEQGNCEKSIIAFLSIIDTVADAFPLNSSGMYRGVITADGVPRVAIFADEELD